MRESLHNNTYNWDNTKVTEIYVINKIIAPLNLDLILWRKGGGGRGERNLYSAVGILKSMEIFLFQTQQKIGNLLGGQREVQGWIPPPAPFLSLWG